MLLRNVNHFPAGRSNTGKSCLKRVNLEASDTTSNPQKSRSSWEYCRNTFRRKAVGIEIYTASGVWKSLKIFKRRKGVEVYEINEENFSSSVSIRIIIVTAASGQCQRSTKKGKTEQNESDHLCGGNSYFEIEE